VNIEYDSAGKVYWTTYTYDCLGRTLAMAPPDGANATHPYQGNPTRMVETQSGEQLETTMRMSSFYSSRSPLKRWLAAAAVVVGAPILRLDAQSWYDNAWSNRKSITIHYNQVSGSSNLTDFPLLVSVTGDTNLKSVFYGGKVGKNDASHRQLPRHRFSSIPLRRRF